jgi:hypothetical protein
VRNYFRNIDDQGLDDVLKNQSIESDSRNISSKYEKSIDSEP